jgi:hypothetical protein
VRRDYTALIILAVLGSLEIAILYLLIAVDTPLAPMVRRLLENPAGVFTLVMIVVTLLCFGRRGRGGGRASAGAEATQRASPRGETSPGLRAATRLGAADGAVQGLPGSLHLSEDIARIGPSGRQQGGPPTPSSAPSRMPSNIVSTYPAEA